MPDYAGAVDAIEQRVVTGFTAAPVTLLNDRLPEPWPPMDEMQRPRPWVRVEVRSNGSAQRAIGRPGNQLWVYRGHVVAHVFVPIGEGSARARTYAITIGELFRNKAFYRDEAAGAVVRTSAPWVDDGEPQGNYFRVTMTCPFEFFYRDGSVREMTPAELIAAVRREHGDGVTAMLVADYDFTRTLPSGLPRFVQAANPGSALVAADDQFVGVVIDEADGGVVVADLATNGAFVTGDATGWAVTGPGVDFSVLGQVTIADVGGIDSYIEQGVVADVGDVIQGRIVVTQNSGSTSSGLRVRQRSRDLTGSVVGDYFLPAGFLGEFVFYFLADVPNPALYILVSTTGVSVVITSVEWSKVAAQGMNSRTDAQRAQLVSLAGRRALYWDGTDNYQRSALTPAPAITVWWAGQFSGTEDVAFGCADTLGGRFGVGVDADGKLQLRLGTDLISLGSDIRGVSGALGLRIDGAAYRAIWKPVGGEAVVWSGTFAGDIPTSLPIWWGAENLSYAPASHLDGYEFGRMIIYAPVADGELAAVVNHFAA